VVPGPDQAGEARPFSVRMHCMLVAHALRPSGRHLQLWLEESQTLEPPSRRPRKGGSVPMHPWAVGGGLLEERLLTAFGPSVRTATLGEAELLLPTVSGVPLFSRDKGEPFQELAPWRVPMLEFRGTAVVDASSLRRNRPLLLLRNRPGTNPERTLDASSQPPGGGERGRFSVGILSLWIRTGHLAVASDSSTLHAARRLAAQTWSPRTLAMARCIVLRA